MRVLDSIERLFPAMTIETTQVDSLASHLVDWISCQHTFLIDSILGQHIFYYDMHNAANECLVDRIESVVTRIMKWIPRSTDVNAFLFSVTSRCL